jgi:hypothetical protein
MSTVRAAASGSAGGRTKACRRRPRLAGERSHPGAREEPSTGSLSNLIYPPLVSPIALLIAVTLAVHLGGQRGEPARIVVWAHNSHVGDARATEAATEDELTTYTGTVTAASDWEDPAERKLVRPAQPAASRSCSTRSARRRSGSRVGPGRGPETYPFTV